MRSYLPGLALLFFSTTCAVARGVDVISLSVFPTEVRATLGQSVDLTVTFTNTSSTPRYVGRAAVTSLEYAVKNSAGRVLVPLSDPPAPPPTPYADDDFIWLAPGQSFVFHQRISLDSWGIESVGRFTVVAFSNGTLATADEWLHKKYGFFFSFAPQIAVAVVANK
jgi:hypothetical protein